MVGPFSYFFSVSDGKGFLQMAQVGWMEMVKGKIQYEILHP